MLYCIEDSKIALKHLYICYTIMNIWHMSHLIYTYMTTLNVLYKCYVNIDI